MISINLLPVQKIKNRNYAKLQILVSIIFYFCFLCTILAIIYYQINIKSILKNKLDKINIEKNKYSKIVNQVKRIESEKNIFEKKIYIIKKLKEQSLLTVHILDEIARITPINRMWIKSINQYSYNLNISGMALDDQTIAQYMDDMELSRYIYNVILLNTESTRYSGKNLKSFNIYCKIKFN